ncbi:acyltransferase family protein [Frateuria hangzhouensis]|uniref:acyltransferase family protein n=1 Tax=Frateuria hangzhouensis TaxID=2995589 RepID=UPI002260DCD4|nr:acyltransferase family protein [Frateuria sp. STR12]MCX7513564.1 acyltransferase family protein [Frateuria sp. STR12]
MKPLPARAPPVRDPWKDNARLALITLVVFGHCLEPLRGVASIDALYRFLYLFHMPAFVFLSGAVARADVDLKLLKRIAFQLLLPYLLFQGLYALAAHAPGWPDDGPAGITTPYWLLWYLPSLAAWRLLLPVFMRLRHPLALAVLLALAAGWADDVGYRMSLSRTVAFFPFFVIGHLYAPAWRERLRGPLACVLALASLFALGWAATTVPDSRWLYGSNGYTALGVDDAAGTLWRLLRLGAGVAGTAAFLVLVPQRAYAVTAAGARSLQAYLAHGFVVKFAVVAGVFGWLEASEPPLVNALALLLAAWVLVRLLASVPAARLLSPLTSPQWLERHLWRAPGA